MTLSRDAQNSKPCNMFFAKAVMNTLSRPLFKMLHWMPVKERILLKIEPPMLSASLMVPCHHTCHPVSLCTLSSTLRFSTDEKTKQTKNANKLFLGQDGNFRALVTGRSLSWLLLSGTTYIDPRIRHFSSLSQFRTLKTFLRTSVYCELL